MEKKICPRCGGEHDLVGCPGVKAVEFGFDLNNAKTIKRVEFLTPADLATISDVLKLEIIPELQRQGRQVAHIERGRL